MWSWDHQTQICTVVNQYRHQWRRLISHPTPVLSGKVGMLNYDGNDDDDGDDDDDKDDDRNDDNEDDNSKNEEK